MSEFYHHSAYQCHIQTASRLLGQKQNDLSKEREDQINLQNRRIAVLYLNRWWLEIHRIWHNMCTLCVHPSIIENDV